MTMPTGLGAVLAVIGVVLAVLGLVSVLPASAPVLFGLLLLAFIARLC